MKTALCSSSCYPLSLHYNCFVPGKETFKWLLDSKETMSHQRHPLNILTFLPRNSSSVTKTWEVRQRFTDAWRCFTAAKTFIVNSKEIEEKQENKDVLCHKRKGEMDVSLETTECGKWQSKRYSQSGAKLLTSVTEKEWKIKTRGLLMSRIQEKKQPIYPMDDLLAWLASFSENGWGL